MKIRKRRNRYLKLPDNIADLLNETTQRAYENYGYSDFYTYSEILNFIKEVGERDYGIVYDVDYTEDDVLDAMSWYDWEYQKKDSKDDYYL